VVTPPAAVEINGWGWRHAGRSAWALRHLDLRIRPGERVLLLGPSGAGKSTLLAALAGLLETDGGGEAEGQLLVDGVHAGRSRDRVGIVFQDPETQLVMARAGDDVAFGLENRSVLSGEIWPRVDRALADVGFGYGRDQPTAALSGGEQQRLALAGVVVLRPGLLLLDEPTANLDPDGARLVRAAIADLAAKAGATMLLVEHRVDEAISLVDRAVVLAPGAGVVADGTPSEVFATHGDRLAAAGVWVPGHPVAGPSRAAQPTGETLIQARQAGFRYPGADRFALTDADLDLRAGEALAMVGPNGSGKSTLAMLLGGLLRPSAGSVMAGPGLAPGQARVPLWRWAAGRLAGAVGSVFQDPEHQFLTGRCRDELELGPRRLGLGAGEAARRADELLERLHLGHLAEANPYTLSGGEKRRLSVASALATAPVAMILDEPTFGQDRRTWAELLTLLAALRDDGRGVVVATHDLPFAAALADRTVSLRDGRLAAEDP
jgi:energy-coupling factor transport system ATP-binding protein